MKIFILSGAFFPSIGGMETIIDALAREFVALGHEVRLATTAPPDPDPSYDKRFPYPVLRNPSALTLFREVRWGDVYYHNGPFIKKAWPLLVLRRPWVIEHMLWHLGTPGEPMTLRQRVNTAILRRAAWHMGLSHAMVRYLPFPSEYVPTPFRSNLLRVMPEVPRDRDICFAGRVIREKGVQILLEALAILRSRGRRYTTTIIGRGNDLEEFRALSASLGLDDQVEFPGVKLGEEFARLLNRHEVMAVPSVWDEAFGAVAPEGIACGCVVVASDSGGLPEAVGKCGVIFPRGDINALADRLEELLEHRDRLQQYREPAEAHLAQFSQKACAEARLKIFERILGRG